MDPLRQPRLHVIPRVIVGAVALAALAATPAALAYEGYGHQTAGGQGGDICHVTNLAASGGGSFANCVESRSGARIVVFDVGGTITLDQTLYITSPYLTIDGTTAPAPGITIRPQNSGRTALAIENTHDIIVKGIRLWGYGTEDGADLLRIDGDVGEVHHIVADHLTLAAADDGAMDITSNARDITVSWCFFYGSELSQLIKYGTQRRMSVHHNVYANATPKGERNPLLWGDLADFDYVNNIVYGWYFHGVMIRHGGDVGNNGKVKANLVNNLFWHEQDATIQDALVYGSHAGPDAEDGGPAGTPAQGTVVTSTNMGQLWVSGNILPPLNQDQYSTVSGPLSVPAAAQVTTWPASELPSRVLPSVGTGHRTSAEQALLDEVGGGTLPTTHTLTVTKAGAGAGTVTSSPAGISCGTDCSQAYNSGTVVTLSQAATAGSTFTGWSGACTGTGACQVTMSAAKSVTATFTLISNTLTVTKAGNGSGTVTSSPAGISCGTDCSQAYNSGTVVTLSQAATAGSTFTGWSGACTGTGACQVTMSAAKSVTATFTLSTYNLTVAKAGTGAGTVTSSPAGISCGSDCSQAYNSGTVVTLSQAATAGSTFTGWSGACTGTGACQVTMSAAKSVTATFTLNTGLPALSITGASLGEGDAGHQVVFLRVSLSAPTVVPVTVAYSTANGTALARRDYLPASGTLLFPEGTVAGELALWISGDLATEATETFTVNLARPENATIASGPATVTIVDNDPMPALAVTDVLVREGHVTSHNAVFRVTLSVAAPAEVNVDWTTADLTARAGEDYLPSGGTLTIRKGSRVGSVIVPVVGDRADERNEAFLVSLSNATGARIVDGKAQGVIWDDDGEKDTAIPIASLPYVATRPGRYRLVGDLVFAPAQGAAVTIAASRTVLDLDGHTLSGSAGAATEALGVLSRKTSGITVQNGKVQGFLAGVFLSGRSRLAVHNLNVHSSTYAGIWLEGRGNQVDACKVLDTGGTIALDPGAGAVGISSVGVAPKLTGNEVSDTVAPNGGDAFGIAADRATRGILSGNLVRNSSSGAATGILVTRALNVNVSQNAFDTLDYGIVFTGEARGTCTGNSMTGVGTPTVGVTCEP